MDLKLGRMSLRELSVWFGNKPDTLAKAKPATKEKKFKILKTYAEYHFEGKDLIIDRIKYPTYTKAFNIIEEEFPKRWGYIKDDKGQINEVLKKERIDTCARVGSNIWKNIPEVKSQIVERTAKEYVNKIKREQYGRNYKEEYGTKGRCISVRMNEEGTRPLNDEENEIVKQCIAIAYADVGEKIAELDEDYKNGLMTKEEYKEEKGQLETMDSFEHFQELVIEKLGYYPIKRTKLIDTREFA